jgi:ATP-dependent protease ClpP protease subunit
MSLYYQMRHEKVMNKSSTYIRNGRAFLIKVNSYNVVIQMIAKKTTTKTRAQVKPTVDEPHPIDLVIPCTRTVEWIGSVNSESYNRTLQKIKELQEKDPLEIINLIVTSPGGSSGVAMSFYDVMRTIYRTNLCCIGSGDVDSSGIIIFLTGRTRILTPNTTLLLHMAGRSFDGTKRMTSAELRAMAEEDELKDFQYAAIIAEASEGRLAQYEVLEMMRKNTILTPQLAVEYGLAHSVLSHLSK